MIWDSEPFYNKSKLYVQQADALPPENRFYVMWHLLAFEFLVKSCVALKSKPLLAESRNAHSLLFSLGIEATKTPTQRAIKELLEFSKLLIPNFTDEDYKKSLSLIGFRNEELHTASDRLTEIAETGWLGDYYRIVKRLLIYLGKDIGDYFGQTKVVGIERILSALDAELISEVKKEIASARNYYAKLSNDEKTKIKTTFRRPPKTKVTKCPSCGENYAVIVGELIKTSEPQLEDGKLYSQIGGLREQSNWKPFSTKADKEFPPSPGG